MDWHVSKKVSTQTGKCKYALLIFYLNARGTWKGNENFPSKSRFVLHISILFDVIICTWRNMNMISNFSFKPHLGMYLMDGKQKEKSSMSLIKQQYFYFCKSLLQPNERDHKLTVTDSQCFNKFAHASFNMKWNETDTYNICTFLKCACL